MVNVPATYGALLLGGLYASLLSGLVALQVIIYFKVYEGDRRRIKALVLFIWFLDVLHTALVWAGLWDYLIVSFGDTQQISNIYWSVSTTVAVTGILTFVVHCFFSHRIFMLSRRNWYLVIPILLLALCRLMTTAEMILNNTFPSFKAHFKWVFTLGLVLSTAVDILITGCLFFLLKTSRTSDFNLNAVIDTLIRYAFETGALTTAGTIVAMIFWLAMNDNLVFMGLHFVIAKLYANSILVTLNTRKDLRRARSSTGPRENGFQIVDGRRVSRLTFTSKDSSNVMFPPIRSPKVTINIERSVHCEEDPM
ncbi:hypothetical protein NP233_g1767 [Leucocoprinus birnbaumii]|uniref:DUF6534 domain-containing protein n=1 Tax=Leucocoprinus birnbaumii TaxID=56174 RepID=A0AAD5W2K2_9AGAR|nr:hypothetical protein NP233_g1767 [Leucocoprinus birnbaumii]